MLDFGGRAIPGVSINVGRGAKEDLSDLRRGVDELRKSLADLKRQADDAARSVAAATSAAGGRRGSTRTATPDTARVAKEAERQQRQAQQAELRRQRDATRAAQNVPKVFAGMSSAGLKTDKEFLQYNKAIHERYEHALKQNEELTAADRKILSNSRNVAGAIAARKGESALSKGVNAVSWAPIPGGQNIYMMQMAMESMMLNPAIMAGVVGAMLVGGAALGLNEMLVSQTASGQAMAQQLGTTPDFVTGAGATGELATRAQQLHLQPKDAMDLASGLAAGGMGRNDALGAGLTNAADAMNVFGLSAKDASTLVTKYTTDLGYSSDQVARAFQGIAQAALATGVPVSNAAQILVNSPDLAANIPAAAQGAAAAMFSAVGGGVSQGTTIANLINAHGAQAAGLASMLGLSGTAQLDQIRNSGAVGQGQLTDTLAASARAMVAQSGPEVGFTVFNARAQAATGQTLDWDSFQRLLQDQPGAAAAKAALPALLGPAAPVGGANTPQDLLAAGNAIAAAAAGVPWNVKDMAVASLHVDLASFGNQLQSAAAALNPARPTGTLNTVAAGGGPAAEAANIVLGVHGNATAASAAANNALDFLTRAGPLLQGIANPMSAGPVIAGAVIQHELHLAVDIIQGGKTVGAKQITTALPNSGQTYNQYVPTRAKPGN